MGSYKGERFIVVFLLFFLAFLGSVDAEIIVNGPDKTSVNIGDEITLGGYVLHTKDILGLLKFELQCGDQNNILMVKSVSLKSGLKKDFSDSFAIVNVNEANCIINVALESAGNVLESKDSSQFKVTPALTGTFSIDKKTIQAGASLMVKGTAFKQDGSNAEGFAIITLKKDGQVYFSDTADLKNGLLEHAVVTTDVPGGEYVVEVEARDGFGNYLVTEAGRVSVIDKIEVNARTEKVNYLPQDKVVISGTANVLEGKLKDGKVYATMDENRYEDDVSGGDFALSYYLHTTIKSGRHDLFVRVEDEYGNFGDYLFSIIVDPVPTKMVVVADKEAINPGESINVKAFLNDQAGDVMDTDVTVQVVNEKDDVFYESVKKSSEQFAVEIAGNVIPGNYFIRGSYGDVVGEKLFIVGRVVALEYSLDGQELVVKNIGNVLYAGLIQIKLDGLDKSSAISKDIDLGIGQEERIRLGKGLPTGTYKVTVDNKVFENVEITGSSKISWKIVSYIAAFLFLVLFFLWLRKRSKGTMKRIDRTLREGRVVHSNRKHGEFGGAALTRVTSDEDHVRKFKDYMQRSADFRDEPKRISGLGKKSSGSTVFSFGNKKKAAQAQQDAVVSNVFSGVKTGWRKDAATKPAESNKKDKSPGNLFGLFDM